MSINKTIQKLFSVKFAVTVILLLLVAGSIYVAVHKKNIAEKDSAGSKQELVVKSSGLDENQKVVNVGDVEKVVAKWVEANPEAIIQSVVAMQQKKAAEQQKDAQKNIGTKKSDLFSHKSDPEYAPKGYNISVVEFFDYNCGYCKKAQSTVEQLLKDDKKVRFIYKELPILGPSSIELAKVSIAVNIVDRASYVKFHNALMAGGAKTTEDALAIAKNAGIDVEKVRKALDSKKSEIEEQIKFNQELASSVGVNGTPGFVIGDELVPGAMDLSSLKEKIATQRKK